MQDPHWTRCVQQSIVRGVYSEEDYNRDMNALFVKLHLLDPQSVIPAYQFLLNQRGVCWGKESVCVVCVHVCVCMCVCV